MPAVRVAVAWRCLPVTDAHRSARCVNTSAAAKLLRHCVVGWGPPGIDVRPGMCSQASQDCPIAQGVDNGGGDRAEPGPVAVAAHRLLWATATPATCCTLNRHPQCTQCWVAAIPRPRIAAGRLARACLLRGGAPGPARLQRVGSC